MNKREMRCAWGKLKELALVNFEYERGFVAVG